MTTLIVRRSSSIRIKSASENHMSSSAVFVAAILLASTVQLFGQQPPTQLVGCISEVPNGGLQFQASPSGSLYLLQGATSNLTPHVNQFVRITVSAAGNITNGSQALPTLLVQTIDVIDQSCTSALPSEKAVVVGGKVGEGEVAVPVTTSASAGETTPGFQTDTITAQGAPNNGRSTPGPAQQFRRPYSPSNTAQAAQQAAEADTYAQAATRSEIQPGNTLGASLAPVSGQIERTNIHPVVVELRGEQKQEFSPARVTIKVGGAVQWKNASSQLHEINDNPENTLQLSGTGLPAGSRPFDSGFLRPGSTFTQTFSTPGQYHYLCSYNCSGTPTGEVVVER